jgi:hypothetical protein
MRDEELAAYHDAGHAVAAFALGAVFSCVVLDPEAGAGLVRRDCALPGARLGPADELAVALAGPLAEGSHGWGCARHGLWLPRAAPDLAAAEGGLAPGGGPDTQRQLAKHIERAVGLVERHWATIGRVAAALDERGALPYAAVASLYAGAALSHVEALALAARLRAPESAMAPRPAIVWS